MAETPERFSSSRDAGRTVRDIRKRTGLTQAQFGDVLGVTALTVHRWESGQSRPLRMAVERLRELENRLAEPDTPERSTPSTASPAMPPLDFAGNAEGISAVAEALRLAYGHQFNPAFASETARIHPLPHQRIAVYERMLGQDPLRFLLADDAGAGKTIMTGLYVREMLSRGASGGCLSSRRPVWSAIGSGSFVPCSACRSASSPERTLGPATLSGDRRATS